MGDPIYDQTENPETNAEIILIMITYVLQMKKMYRNHTIKAVTDYPVCDSDNLNYFKLNNMYYESYDAATLMEKMKESYQKKKILSPVNFQIRMYMHRRERISSIIFSHRHPRGWHNIMASAGYGTAIQNIRSITESQSIGSISNTPETEIYKMSGSKV